MAKDEFNRSTTAKKPGKGAPPIFSAEQMRELRQFLSDIKEARAKDPLFDQKCMDAWIAAEMASDPDDYDDLNADKLMDMLKDNIPSKQKPKFGSK